MKNLSDKSTEELVKSKKTIQVLTSLLAGALLLLFIVNIILSLKKGFSALFIIPIALMPIVIINLSNLKEINSELKSREE